MELVIVIGLRQRAYAAMKAEIRNQKAESRKENQEVLAVLFLCFYFCLLLSAFCFRILTLRIESPV
jgi:hypothetical protein